MPVTIPPPRGPYADAPRLPDGDVVDLRTVVSGAWLELEVGPGPKAGFLSERAVAVPEAGLVGLEIRRKWASVGDGRLAKEGHASRARVFCEDARQALPRLGPAGSVARAFLHFPDPWWKKRHTKRLVMGDVFLDEVARLLGPGGELYVQTDVEERALQYEEVVGSHGAFVAAGDHEGSPRMVDNPYAARSPREHRAITDGLPVWRMRWHRR
ncbi:MAG: tRNA (guanine46-N7-)-methyltransferase [Labilithrix sp.]|nr:tRNA (guanine46-N7-)-methyltransferase [Labilithrix sp.]